MRLLNHPISFEEPTRIRWQCTRCEECGEHPLKKNSMLADLILECSYCGASWNSAFVIHRADNWVKRTALDLLEEIRDLDWDDPHFLDMWGIEQTSLRRLEVGTQLSRTEILMEDG